MDGFEDFVDDRDLATESLDEDRCTLCGDTSSDLERDEYYGKVIYICPACVNEAK